MTKLELHVNIAKIEAELAASLFKMFMKMLQRITVNVERVSGLTDLKYHFAQKERTPPQGGRCKSRTYVDKSRKTLSEMKERRSLGNFQEVQTWQILKNASKIYLPQMNI